MTAVPDPHPMACPGCAAAPVEMAVPEVQPDDILLSLPRIHCHGCIRNAESALMDRPDVAEARVNLTLKRAYVTPRSAVHPSALIETLGAAGIEAHELDPGAIVATETDKAGRDLLMRLAVAGFAAMNVMLLSVSVWSGASDATRDLFHWISAAIALPATAYAGQPFFAGAWQALRARRLNMDVPIALAIVLALGTSLWETALSGHHAYFDAALTLVFFLLAGRYLDFRTRSAARSAAEELTALEVPRATRLVDGKPFETEASELCVDDLILVGPGGRIPVDGVIVDGSSELDRSFLSGESAAVQAQVGMSVAAGEVNLTGPLAVRATAIGKDTTLHRMADLVAVAEAGRANYTPLADKAAALYAPGVHILAALSFVGWYLGVGDLRVALNIAAAVLIITCPCALGLAVPAVTTAASGRLFRKGLLIKSGTALERLADVDIVVFDKTGTLTTGTPEVENWGSLGQEARSVALALAAGSSHPLAKAIVAAAGAMPPADVGQRHDCPGFGTEGVWLGRQVRLGRPGWAGPDQDGGLCTMLDLGEGQSVRIDFKDQVRPGAAEAVAGFKRAGLNVVLLSGDRPDPVREIADTLGIDEWHAAMLPDEKAKYVADQPGRVLMIGDGLNDTAALALAHVSISPASALDAARVASDIVLMGADLSVLTEAHGTAQKATRRIRENFQIATLYNLVAVPLAVAGLATPLIAALAMSSSSITVSLNALRVR